MYIKMAGEGVYEGCRAAAASSGHVARATYPHFALQHTATHYNTPHYNQHIRRRMVFVLQKSPIDTGLFCKTHQEIYKETRGVSLPKEPCGNKAVWRKRHRALL